MTSEDKLIFFPAIFFISLGLVAVLVVARAQPPAAPAAPALYSIQINGQPVSGNAPLNLVSGAGVLFSSPQAVNGVTQVTVTPDLAYLLGIQADQNFGAHLVNGISNPPGSVYLAQAAPVLGSYEQGQPWVFVPDVPTLPGATLNIGQLGPVPISGSCVKACWLLTTGPPWVFLVH
jgi:hypothetical protein